MKKSRTQKAVDAVLRSRERIAVWKKLHPEWRKPGGFPKEWPMPKALTIYAAAKRFGLNEPGVHRAVKRRLSEKRCKACGQVMR